MKKLISLLVLASIVPVAIAADKPVVVKDTRQYMPYTQSIMEDGVCSLAKDPDHPQKGDCEEKRDKAVVGGELLIRFGSSCRREIYGRLDNDALLEDRPILSLSQKVDQFKCDEHGNPV